MQVTIPPPPELPQVIVQGPSAFPPFWVTMDPKAIVFMSLGFFAAAAVILYPLMRAIGRRLEGKAVTGDPALREEFERLHARLGEVDALQHRVMELEERLDFAERMLAQRREPDRLGRGEV
jgi:hypothetical protein